MGTTGFRLLALLALAIPVCAGAATMAAMRAPLSYPLVNGGALIAGGIWIVFGRGPRSRPGGWIGMALAIAVLIAPLLVGPHYNGIARWIALGPFTLNTGFIALPALAILAARDPDNAPLALLVALFVVSLQPDGAAGFAITFAAVGLYHVARDWRMGLVCIVAFFAAIAMTLRGELPPQPFVERVLFDATAHSPFIAAGLIGALAACYLLILYKAPLVRVERFALAGTLFGFLAAALMSHYPYPFIGYGASAILGYALALGLVRPRAAETP